jgi:hypothetical protein
MTAFLWIAALVIAANAIYFLYRSKRDARRVRRLPPTEGRAAETRGQRDPSDPSAQRE